MLNLLKLLIFGHLHKWAVIADAPFERWEDSPTDIVHRGRKYTCRCEKCGEIKAFTP